MLRGQQIKLFRNSRDKIDYYSIKSTYYEIIMIIILTNNKILIFIYFSFDLFLDLSCR